MEADFLEDDEFICTKTFPLVNVLTYDWTQYCVLKYDDWAQYCVLKSDDWAQYCVLKCDDWAQYCVLKYDDWAQYCVPKCNDGWIRTCMLLIYYLLNELNDFMAAEYGFVTLKVVSW